jgi:hypothetical protein
MCLAAAAGALALGQAAGCSGDSSNGAAADAGRDTSSGDAGGSGSDAGGVTSLCAGDPPVMKWLDLSGNLQDPDWSCYEADAAFAAPFVPAPLRPRLLLGDGGDDAADSADDVASGDASADAIDEAVEAGQPDGGMPDAATALDTFTLTDFTSRTTQGAASVDIFFGNTVAGGVKPDESGVTAPDDASPPGFGSFLFGDPPGALFAYRVNARTSPSPALHTVIQLDNLPPPSGGVFQGNSITESAYQFLVSGFLSVSQAAPGTTQLVTAVRDCAGHDLLGGIVDLIDDATSQPLPTGNGATDLHWAYFGSDSFPRAECTHTVASPLALWSALNVPSDRKLRIRLRGRMHATDAQPVSIDERVLELVPDVIMIERAYRLTPLR